MLATQTHPKTSIPVEKPGEPPAVIPAIVKLSELIKVDVDSMNPAVAKSLIALGVQPEDQTSNQILVGDGILDPDNASMLQETVKQVGHQGWEAVYDRMSVLLCKKNLPNIAGRVLLQTSPSQAYNTQAIVDHARRYAAEFEKAGIPKDRFCIKIPATGPGMNAGSILLKEGIRTLGTSLFSVPQAVASSQAGCLYISPYYNEVKAHDMSTGLFPDVKDPAVEHPMSPRMVQIREAYRKLEQNTRKPQPLIKGASNITAAEILGCVEMGVHHITILAPQLEQLCKLLVKPNSEADRQGSISRDTPYEKPLSSRMTSLLRKDPLAPKDIDQEEFVEKSGCLDVDYLVDNGAALDAAISADPETLRRLDDALNLFIEAENRAKAAIQAAIEEHS